MEKALISACTVYSVPKDTVKPNSLGNVREDGYRDDHYFVRQSITKLFQSTSLTVGIT